MNSSGNIYGRRGLALRLLNLLLACAAWLLTLGRRRDRVVVLCYHGVTSAQRRAFEWQMRRIAGRVVPASALGQRHLPVSAAPAVCITFDDAFANLRENAVPILRRLRMPATVFAVSDNLGAPPRWSMPSDHPDREQCLLSAAQLRALVRSSPVRVGAHTASHPRLTTLTDAAVRYELSVARQRLQQVLGREVDDLSFPYGDWDERTLRAARAAGYRRIYTLAPRLHAGPADEVIGRFLMSPDVWPVEFLLTCAGAYAWREVWHTWRARLRNAPVRLRPRGELT